MSSLCVTTSVKTSVTGPLRSFSVALTVFLGSGDLQRLSRVSRTDHVVTEQIWAMGLTHLASLSQPLHCVDAVRGKTCPVLEAFCISFGQQRILDLVESTPEGSSLLAWTHLDAEIKYYHSIDIMNCMFETSVSWCCNWKGTFVRYLNELQMQMQTRFDSDTWEDALVGRVREVMYPSSKLHMARVLWWLFLYHGHLWIQSTVRSSERDVWLQQLKALWQQIGVAPEQEFRIS